MKIIHGIESFEGQNNTAVVIGKFDCIHMGHDLILHDILSHKSEQLDSLVFTFQESPRFFLQTDTSDLIHNKNLITNEERRVLLSEKGIDYLVECDFDDEMRHMEPEEFIKMLVHIFHMKYISCTESFHFGYQGRGDILLLQEMAKQYDFTVHITSPVSWNHSLVSSSRIRKELSLGHITTVNQLLGYEYFIHNKIVHGMHIGSSKLSVPTINMLPPNNKLLPPNGVYVTKIRWNHVDYFGVTNIGYKPTVVREDKKLSVETYIFDFSEDIYEEYADVFFLNFIRQEQKFDSLDSLKEQIMKDQKIARKFISSYKN